MGRRNWKRNISCEYISSFSTGREKENYLCKTDRMHGIQGGTNIKGTYGLTLKKPLISFHIQTFKKLAIELENRKHLLFMLLKYKNSLRCKVFSNVSGPFNRLDVLKGDRYTYYLQDAERKARLNRLCLIQWINPPEPRILSRSRKNHLPFRRY